METKIIDKKKNVFLNREEMTIQISSDKAPSISSIKEAVDKGNELVVVKKVNSNFGRRKFTADVFVYGSLESKNRTETLSRKSRDKIKDEKKAAGEAAKKAKAESAPKAA